jgi:hypothetical protein
MADVRIPTSQDPPAAPGPERPMTAPMRPIAAGEERISFGPNLIAMLASFVFLLIAPLVSFPILYGLLGNGYHQVPPFLPLMVLAAAVVVAVGGSLLFLVVGLILQLWQRHQPFANWWPVVLAIPTAWALLLPQTLARGGSVRFWLILGTGIAVAFSVHWLALVGAREAID